MTEVVAVPEGFAPHFRKSPLTDPWEPLYSQKIDGTVRLGTRVRQPHVNGRASRMAASSPRSPTMRWG